MKHVLALTAACCLLVGLAAAQVMAIRAGKLVNPDSDTVLPDQVILIRDSRIEKVGKGSRFLQIPQSLISAR